MLLLAACSPVHVVRSNQAKTYAGLTILGERRMEIVPANSARGHFQTVTLAPVLLMPDVAATLSPGVGDRLKAAVGSQLQRQIDRRLGRSGAGQSGTGLLLLVRITSVKEASVGLNIATSVLVGPVSKGQLALEIEAIDASNGRQVALLLLADKADMRDIRKSYTPDGHAKALAGRFAIEAMEFIAPMVRSR
ncbi:DUF3313 family protein [Stenotrophomonas maltophilia]|uniref:DUF3313 family protein n=1 Tax=Stenotrophomonas maltophilia TaxID=40324 RepID=UPI0015DFFBFB|nr:DUF3313 family protein [Stenotrophomonas maltophilia]MBA0282986.1 DUF3313 family protein [Stenotrophomonas maltophilia]MBA0346376.1 DUF3313 family protein [Stenotrophomonas maltophilia]MBA0359460.1 DUF3313 family protein [Stenotrophomonas maltophilia]MBA0519075.1 DUF3313 family protein [Stenotrophomonas maltophilia]